MSIYTFLEDTKYLELGARILKKLFLEKCKGSLRERFNSVRTGQTKIKVQTSEFTFQDRQLASVSESAWVSYRQLWLYALRHFPGLDKKAPLMDSGSESSWQTRSEPQWWVDLSQLAYQCGYREIHQMFRDHQAAEVSSLEEKIKHLRSQKYYQIDQALIQERAKAMQNLLQDIPRRETSKTTPYFVKRRNIQGVSKGLYHHHRQWYRNLRLAAILGPLDHLALLVHGEIKARGELLVQRGPEEIKVSQDLGDPKALLATKARWELKVLEEAKVQQVLEDPKALLAIKVSWELKVLEEAKALMATKAK
ncbi:structural constituent of cuticle [Exophiala oligosperma]